MNQHFLTVLVFAFLTILGASAQVNTTQRHLENSSQTLESNLSQILKEDGSERKSHVLFFFPIITKSAKITFMPVAEKMAERGHEVIVPGSTKILFLVIDFLFCWTWILVCWQAFNSFNDGFYNHSQSPPSNLPNCSICNNVRKKSLNTVVKHLRVYSYYLNLNFCNFLLFLLSDKFMLSFSQYWNKFLKILI